MAVLDDPGDRDDGVTLVGEADEAGAGIARVGDPFDVAVLLELVDEVAGRGLGDLGGLGELGQPRAGVVDALGIRAWARVSG